jgi:hypothetical protein
MGYQTARVGSIAFALTFVATAVMLGSQQVEAGPVPTPSPASTPLEPPAAPSEFEFGIPSSTTGGLVWQDNSDNEDGFRLRKTVGFAEVPPQVIGPTVFAEVPANTTQAAVPSLTDEEFCAGVELSIVAFNAAGESEAAEGPDMLATDCLLGPPPTAVSPVVVPETGSGSRGGASGSAALLTVGSALVLVLGGAGALGLRRRLGTR